MAKEATFQMLIDMCNQIGWDNGISGLEKIVLQNENMQANLFAGTPEQVKEAKKWGKVIIIQNTTIGRLKQYRKDHDL